MDRRPSTPPATEIRPFAVLPQSSAPANRDDDGIPKVMLVSPDDAFCAAAACRSTEAGFSVVVAGNSMSAIGILFSHNVDGLITTVRMPRGHPNGLALARLVRDQNSTSMVIFLTDEARFVAAETTLLDGKSAMVCPAGDVPELIRRTQAGLERFPDTSDT